MTPTLHRLTIIPGKKTPAPPQTRPKKTGKPPEEWTPEETASVLTTVGEIYFLLTQLLTAQREGGRRKPECAREVRRAMEALALFHSAAAIVLMLSYG